MTTEIENQDTLTPEQEREALRKYIKDRVYQNENNEVTGQMNQEALLALIRDFALRSEIVTPSSDYATKAYVDGAVKELADGAVKNNTTNISTNTNAITTINNNWPGNQTDYTTSLESTMDTKDATLVSTYITPYEDCRIYYAGDGYYDTVMVDNKCYISIPLSVTTSKVKHIDDIRNLFKPTSGIDGFFAIKIKVQKPISIIGLLGIKLETSSGTDKKFALNNLQYKFSQLHDTEYYALLLHVHNTPVSPQTEMYKKSTTLVSVLHSEGYDGIVQEVEIKDTTSAYTVGKTTDTCLVNSSIENGVLNLSTPDEDRTTVIVPDANSNEFSIKNGSVYTTVNNSSIAYCVYSGGEWMINVVDKSDYNKISTQDEIFKVDHYLPNVTIDGEYADQDKIYLQDNKWLFGQYVKNGQILLIDGFCGQSYYTIIKLATDSSNNKYIDLNANPHNSITEITTIYVKSKSAFMGLYTAGNDVVYNEQTGSVSSLVKSAKFVRKLYSHGIRESRNVICSPYQIIYSNTSKLNLYFNAMYFKCCNEQICIRITNNTLRDLTYSIDTEDSGITDSITFVGFDLNSSNNPILIAKPGDHLYYFSVLGSGLIYVKYLKEKADIQPATSDPGHIITINDTVNSNHSTAIGNPIYGISDKYARQDHTHQIPYFSIHPEDFIVDDTTYTHSKHGGSVSINYASPLVTSSGIAPAQNTERVRLFSWGFASDKEVYKDESDSESNPFHYECKYIYGTHLRNTFMNMTKTSNYVKDIPILYSDDQITRLNTYNGEKSIDSTGKISHTYYARPLIDGGRDYIPYTTTEGTTNYHQSEYTALYSGYINVDVLPAQNAKVEYLIRGGKNDSDKYYSVVYQGNNKNMIASDMAGVYLFGGEATCVLGENEEINNVPVILMRKLQSAYYGCYYIDSDGKPKFSTASIFNHFGKSSKSTVHNSFGIVGSNSFGNILSDTYINGKYMSFYSGKYGPVPANHFVFLNNFLITLKDTNKSNDYFYIDCSVDENTPSNLTMQIQSNNGIAYNKLTIKLGNASNDKVELPNDVTINNKNLNTELNKITALDTKVPDLPEGYAAGQTYSLKAVVTATSGGGTTITYKWVLEQ